MSMPAKNEKRINLEASGWLVRNSAGVLNEKDQKEFEAWHNADARHARAYNEAENTWQEVAELEHLANVPLVDDPLLRERALASIRNFTKRFRGALTRPVFPAALAGAAILVAFVWFSLPGSDVILEPTSLMTEVAEIKELELPDGSIVTLGARSAIEVAFTEGERRITLTEGEAFFEITKDPTRPFFVAVDDTVVRVVGTKFDVHRGADLIRVTVLEGIVEVTSPNLTESGKEIPITRVLGAGDQIITSLDGLLEPIRKVTNSEPGAWREGRLVYEDMSLAEVIADANRYYPGEILFASEELKSLRITASFRADEIDRMINTLELVLPLRAVRPPDGRIILVPNPDDN
ncbi:MAG: FecR family protein [Sphingomonadales bacterium]